MAAQVTGQTKSKREKELNRHFGNCAPERQWKTLREIRKGQSKSWRAFPCRARGGRRRPSLRGCFWSGLPRPGWKGCATSTGGLSQAEYKRDFYMVLMISPSPKIRSGPAPVRTYSNRGVAPPNAWRPQRAKSSVGPGPHCGCNTLSSVGRCTEPPRSDTVVGGGPHLEEVH